MPRSQLRSHLSGSVPVSIGVHLVLLLVLVVIPLVDVMVPMPMMTMPSYVLAAPLPPPPSVVPRAAAVRPASRASAGPPLAAPDTIRPETTPVSAAPIPDHLVDVGLPPAIGVGDPAGAMLTPPTEPVAPAKPQPQAVRAAQLPEMPRKVADMHPLYPDVARQARVEGTVVLEAVIDTTGRVTQLRVLKSVPLLDQAALEAVRQWRYTPSTYGGRPVSVLMTITVRFTLSQ